MAFSFGGAPAASSGGFSFGGAAAPAASAPAFGFGAAASAPAPAASSGGFSFGGAAAAPAAAASSGGFSFGGAAAAPAASSPSLFGAPAASTPGGGFGSAFGAPASSAAASGSGFSFGGALVPASSAPAAAAPSPFGGFGAAAAAPAAAPAAPAGGGALTYSSKFDDLPPQIKDSLNKLQQQISQAESDRVAVSQMPHLQEGPSGGKDVGAEAASLQSELLSVRGSMKLEEEALENFREKAVVLLKAADAVVRTFQRTKLWRDAPTQFKGQVMPTAMQELLSQPVLLPSPFLEQAVAGFADQVREFRKTVSELESAVAADAAAASGAASNGGFPGGVDVTMALPTVVGNLHDYFTHVAAKLERVHVELQTAKAAYRSMLQAQGVYRDPFEKAQAAADKLAKARPHVPSLMPPPPGAAAAAAAAAAAGAPAAAPGAMPGGFGGGGFGAGFGSPFPGTPGAFGTPPGAAALGRTSSKTNRPSKSRR